MVLRLHAMVLRHQLLAHGLCNEWADLAYMAHMAHVDQHLGFSVLFTRHCSRVNSTRGRRPSLLHIVAVIPFGCAGFVDRSLALLLYSLSS